MEEVEEFCFNCKKNVSAANFATHSAFCERNIKVCKICNEPVPVSEQKKHLEEYHIIIPCDDCKRPLEKWLLPKHQEVCPKRLISCEFCDAEIIVDEFDEHVDFCGSRTEKCLLCQKYVMLKEKKTHSELHLLEKKILEENTGKEVEQNIVNEAIGYPSASDQSTPNKIMKSDGCITSCVKNDYSSKNDKVSESRIPGRATASVSDTQKQASKHYTTCHICGQTVPWMDYNIHVPTCASDSGKCSRCAEKVPDYLMKEHVLKKCPKLSKKSYDDSEFKMDAYSRSEAGCASQKDLPEEDQNLKLCPYCKQPCSSDRILQHIRNCSENFFKCHLCCEKVLERDKMKHESSECKELHPRTYSEMYQCPLCGEQLSEEDRVTHESFKCKVLLDINQSEFSFSMPYEDSTRRPCEEKQKNHFEVCFVCNKDIPKHELAQHKKSCLEKQKRPCIYCEKLIAVVSEEAHLMHCEKFKADQRTFADVIKKSSEVGDQKSEVCVTCKNKISKNKWEKHKRTCQKNKKNCRYCDEEVYSENEDIHLKYCKAFPDNQHKSQSMAKTYYEYKGAVPKNTKCPGMVQPKIAKCTYCKTTLNADIVQFHEKECIYQQVECSQCKHTVQLKDWEKHSHKCLSKAKGKGRGKHQKDQESSGFGWNLLNNIFSKSGAKTHEQYENERNQMYENTGNSPILYTRDEPLYFVQSVLDETKIPCEFCDELISASDIVLHETGCNPREVSFAKQELSQDVTSNKINSPRENNQFHDTVSTGAPFFVDDKKFLPPTKFESIKKHVVSEAEPGEFLNTYSGKKEYKSSTVRSVWNIDTSDDEMEKKDSENHDSDEKLLMNKSEKKNASEQIDSDEEISKMITYINKAEEAEVYENNQAIKHKVNIKVTSSKYENTSDISDKHNRSLSEHYQKDILVPNLAASDSGGEKAFVPTCHSITVGSAEDKMQKQTLANFRFCGNKMKNSSHEKSEHGSQAEGDKDVHLKKCMIDLPSQNEIEEEHRRQSKDVEVAYLKKHGLRFNSDLSLSNRESGDIQMVDDNKFEEVLCRKQYEYILNANVKNPVQTETIHQNVSDLKFIAERERKLSNEEKTHKFQLRNPVQDEVLRKKLVGFRFNTNREKNVSKENKMNPADKTENNYVTYQKHEFQANADLSVPNTSSDGNGEKHDIDPIRLATEIAAAEEKLEKLKLTKSVVCDRMKNVSHEIEDHESENKDEDLYLRKHGLKLNSDQTLSNRNSDNVQVNDNKLEEAKYRKAYEYILNANVKNPIHDEVMHEKISEFSFCADRSNLANENIHHAAVTEDDILQYKKHEFRANTAEPKQVIQENFDSTKSLYERTVKTLESTQEHCSRINIERVSTDDDEKMDYIEGDENENVASKREAFTIEPAKNYWNPYRSDEELHMRNQESYENIEKWRKWQNRKSSDSS